MIRELEEKTHDFGAIIEFFEPPAVPGYGAASGLALRLLDKTLDTDYHEFDKLNQTFMAALRKRKELTGLFTFYAANYPQYELVIDNKLAMQKGVSIDKAMNNLDIMIGSTYEQGFIRFNNFFKVYAQASPEFRRFPSDVLNYYVKNEKGEMVPYSAFMTMKKRQGPNEITRYNLYNSAAIRAEPATGYTSGDAIKAVQEVAAATLPRGFDIAWEGLSFDEAARGNEALVIFAVVISVCIPGVSRTVRKLYLAVSRVIFAASRYFRCILPAENIGSCQRCLCPTGAGHVNWFARQKRGIDYRICGSETSPRHVR